MKKYLFVLPLLFLSIVCYAQKKSDYIIFYKPYTAQQETNLYITGPFKFDFNAQYRSLKKANVQEDVNRAVKRKDYRIIALSGNSYVFPGIKEKNWIRYIKKRNFKIIDGTSDAIDLSKPPLQNAAHDYAAKYNKLLLTYLKGHKMP
ncbi:MAG TPA: hypothetical protein VHC47_10450 [Mucilaginibacter sp.]|nr:hypothetical protein [Mucilaginibacter sp.]